ncbi:MAG: hypothetical protein ACREDY_15260, partial [Bradyrhizobium sp.]
MVYDGASNHAQIANRDPLMTPKTARLRLPKLAVVAALALLAFSVQAEVQTDVWSGQRALDIIVQLLKFTPRSMETVG